MTNEEIEELFEEFLDSPELSSWQSDLGEREYQDAKRIWARLVRRAITESGGRLDL